MRLIRQQWKILLPFCRRRKLKILTVRFGPTGLNEASPLAIFQVQKGKVFWVAPKDQAEGTLVYPAAPWGKR